MNFEQLQRAIYDQAKSKALSLNCEASKDLSIYLHDQEISSQRPFEVSNEKELKESIESSDIVLIGDFHTFDQNNKNFIRIIKNLLKKDSDFLIAVEFIHHQNQHIVDAFLNNELTEIEFLEEINYQESWHFPWPHYKTFFELAKKYKIGILAINSDGNLRERDQFAANILLNEVHNKKVLVFIGELHIVANKLPQQLTEQDLKKEVLVIHQNLDEVYWSLGPNQSIIRFNTNEYSLQTSPPWIKYESLNYWFDYLDEDPDFDIHEYVLTKGVFLFNSNIPENFFELCKKISKVLKLDFEDKDLENFNLYDHQALETVLKKVNRIKSDKIHTFLSEQLINGEIFSIPKKRVYFCPTYSFNRLVLITGIHLYQIINEKNKTKLNLEDNEYAFSYFTQKRIFSYFVSKVINPYRKCDRYLDLDNQIAKSIIDSESPEEISLLIKNMNLTEVNHIGKLLGSYIGELLYENFYLKEDNDYQFIWDSILETNYDLTSSFFIIRSLFKDSSYKSQTKRIF